MHAADDLRLIETMRFNGTDIPLLDGHLRRLSRSADHFDVPVSIANVHDRIRETLRALPSGHAWKVRLTVDANGVLRVETEPLPPLSGTEAKEPRRLFVSSVRVDPGNPFRRHKTTRRAVYRRAQREADAAGADEALLLNTRGEITEATWSNIVVKAGMTYLTPPLSCGVLPGVYRHHLLHTLAVVQEAVLTPETLREADDVFCCNAVRGLRPARLLSSRHPPDHTMPRATQ